MEGTDALGIIADLQCGGWSTTLLNNKGVVYTVGQMDGTRHDQETHLEPKALQFPPNVDSSHTTIKQVSAGRSHVLGLSDSGRIWSWHDIGRPGLYIRFLAHDLLENTSRSKGTVRKVVAGWSLSASLIEGIGIVVWTPGMVTDDAEASEVVLITGSEVVGGSNYSRGQSYDDKHDRQLAETVGEVLDFVVLDHLILFNTDLGKLFVAQVDWGNEERRISPAFEIPIPKPTEGQNEDDGSFVTSVQGSFRSFAVFTRSGQVLTSDQDRVMPLTSGGSNGTRRVFDRIPALQDSGVISVAFGDYHFQALHSSGKITSYGKEPQMCGALGLGGNGNPESRLRGMRNDLNVAQDGILVKHAYTTGRQVWFEPEKRDWIRWITAGGADPGESAERVRMALGSPDTRCQGEVSEWIEQQGRDWEKFAEPSANDDGLCAYFALSIAAAGWHSAALILKNDDLASRVRQGCEVPQQPIPTQAGPATQSEGDHAATDTGHSATQQTTWSDTIADYGRYFLGAPPYNGTAAAQTNADERRPDVPPPSRVVAQDEESYIIDGAHAREGVPYKWKGDHFPRLRLQNGDEMPGEVPFDEWPSERPNFQLHEDEWT
jgi:SCF-associated factor 1